MKNKQIKNWLGRTNPVWIGALIGLILSILLGISSFIGVQKGFGTIEEIIWDIIIIFFPPVILGFIIGLIMDKGTRKIGIFSLVGGIITTIIIGPLLLLTVADCWHGCGNKPAQIILTFGAPLFLNNFAEGLWVIIWNFIVGAIVFGFITKVVTKSEAIAKVVVEYGSEMLEPELRPEYIKKLKKIEKDGDFLEFDSFEDLKRSIENA
ncbi:MAG: DUF2683 family protein [Nanoarchaeota archaeon]|nr:DUF2683 family protein [Nanoarchaeota archaeon]